MVGKAERVTLEVLKQHFHMPMQDVAKKFDVCLTFFKRICRQRGVKRWPYRKLKSLQKRACDDEDYDDYEHEIKNTMASITGSDSDGAHDSCYADDSSYGASGSRLPTLSAEGSKRFGTRSSGKKSPARGSSGLDLLAFVASEGLADADEEEAEVKTEETAVEESGPSDVLTPCSAMSSSAAVYEPSLRQQQEAYLAQAHAQLMQGSLMQQYLQQYQQAAYGHSAGMHAQLAGLNAWAPSGMPQLMPLPAIKEPA